MFQQAQRAPDGAGKNSVFYKSLSGIATASGIGAAIILTPLIFRKTRGPLLKFLNEEYGADFGNALLWTFGTAEAAAIFFTVRLLLISLLIWIFAALAARRFPAG